jgi:hypothetical protein
MRPGFCETEQEYHVSKACLFSFLQSPRVLAICDDKEHIPQQILEFVTRHVIRHEDYYAFYHRKFVHHFDEFNNCSHEGTNNTTFLVRVNVSIFKGNCGVQSLQNLLQKNSFQGSYGVKNCIQHMISVQEDNLS